MEASFRFRGKRQELGVSLYSTFYDKYEPYTRFHMGKVAAEWECSRVQLTVKDVTLTVRIPFLKLPRVDWRYPSRTDWSK